MAKGKKTGGRVKGSLNKKTTEILELCEKHDCNPMEVLIEYCKPVDYSRMTPQEALAHASQRFNAAREICKYIYPVKKAVEVSGVNGDPIKNESSFATETIEQFKALVKLKYGAKS